MTFSVFSRCYFVELRVIFVALRYVPFRASNSYHKADIFLHKVLVESVEFMFFSPLIRIEVLLFRNECAIDLQECQKTK